MESIKVSPPGKIGPYVIREEIGRGKTSIVFRAVDQTTNENVAIKILPKQQFHNQAELSKFQNEVTSLFRCHDQHILPLINLSQDSLNFYLITGLCCTDLQKILFTHGKFTEKEAQFIFKQIAEAMFYIHTQGIAHRDIKLENILIESHSNGKIVLSDFGYSIFAQDRPLSKLKCGTIAYVAPEIINNEPYNPFFSDVWSTGILLYALLTNRFPWPTTIEDEMIKHIKSHDIHYPDFLSEQAIDLINHMTHPIPAQRPSFQQILQHQWIKDVTTPLQENSNLCHSQPNFNIIRNVFRSNMSQRVVFNRNSHNISSIFNHKSGQQAAERIDIKNDARNVLQKSHRKTRVKDFAKRKTFPILVDDV